MLWLFRVGFLLVGRLGLALTFSYRGEVGLQEKEWFLGLYWWVGWVGVEVGRVDFGLDFG